MSLKEQVLQEIYEKLLENETVSDRSLKSLSHMGNERRREFLLELEQEGYIEIVWDIKQFCDADFPLHISRCFWKETI